MFVLNPRPTILIGDLKPGERAIIVGQSTNAGLLISRSESGFTLLPGGGEFYNDDRHAAVLQVIQCQRIHPGDTLTVA